MRAEKTGDALPIHTLIKRTPDPKLKKASYECIFFNIG